MIRQVPRTVWLVLALLFAIALALWVQWPKIEYPNRIQEDFRSFYWMLRYEDPDLFPNDPLLRDYIAEIELGPLNFPISSRSPGYSLLFLLASPVIPVILFNKLLIFPLVVITAYYAFRIGEKIRGAGAGFALAIAIVVFNLASPNSINMTEGLQRSFVTPLLLGLIYYLMVDKYISAAIVLFFCGIIYPPVFLLGVITYGLSLLPPERNFWRRQSFWRRAIPLIIVLALFALSLLPAILWHVEGAGSSALTNTGEPGGFGSILNDPQYRPDGRAKLFSVPFVLGRAGLAEKTLNLWHIVILAMLALTIWLLRPESLREFPKPLKHLFLASIIGFVISWFFALALSSFVLYLPSRYTRASLPLVLLIFVVVNADISVGILMERLRRLKPILRWAIFLILLLIGWWLLRDLATGSFDRRSLVYYLTQAVEGRLIEYLVASAFLLLIGVVSVSLLTRYSQQATGEEANRGLPGRFWPVFGVLLIAAAVFYIAQYRPRHRLAEAEDLYSSLQSLPKDALIAGDPNLLSDVPLLSRRSVLFSDETVSTSYDEILDFFDAYYAENPRVVFQFCNEYGVDYLLINKQHHTVEYVSDGQFFYEPYNEDIKKEVMGRTRFVLPQVSRDNYLYEGDNWYVISCESADESVDLNEQIFELPEPDVATSIEWDGKISLLGYDLPPIERNTDALSITVYWLAAQRIDKSYKVYFHVVDPENGSVVAQADVIPRRWSYPTNWWLENEVVKDTITVPLNDVPPGSYELRIGWYDEKTGQRLTASAEAREILPGGSVILDAFER